MVLCERFETLELVQDRLHLLARDAQASCGCCSIAVTLVDDRANDISTRTRECSVKTIGLVR